MDESIVKCLGRIKDNRVTNVYAYDVLGYLKTKSPNVRTFVGKYTVLRQTYGHLVNRLEYISCDTDELDELISECVDDMSVIEVVSKEDKRTAYIPTDFGFHKRLKRMILYRDSLQGVTLKKTANNDTCIRAPNSLDFLIESFSCNYDPLVERIPSIEELLAIQKAGKCMQLVAMNSDPIGYIIFDDINSTHQLRYIFIDQKYRGKYYGKYLFEEFLNINKHIRRCSLWVLDDNETAIKLYTKYGFAFDGIGSSIYRRK